MARTNGPFGPAGTRPPARRHPADDPFAAAQPNGHWPPNQPAHAPQQGQGYHFPPEPEANYGNPQQQPAPFDAYQGGQQHDPYAPQQWGQGDPRGYDLGNYMPNGAQQPYPPADPSPFAQGGPNHDPYAQQQGYAEPDAEYDDEFADEETSGRGRRWMFIVAALVGAVGVGGALAYTYKSFVAPNGGRVPLVKADNNVKTRPDSRSAATNDKRAQGRLGEDAGQQNMAAATPETQDDRSGSDEPGGPRRVRTIPITPGGGPPAGIQVAPQGATPPSIPGIMLENVGPRGQQPPQRVVPQQPPQRVTIGQPPPGVAPPLVQTDEPPPARRVPAPPPQVAKAPPPAAPRAAPAPPPQPPAANTGAGYVAVLSSQKSRMDALKVFADLQQKYGSALSGKTPDVQEADLSARGLGTVYRLVVGPPGSRDAASGICNQIKAAGHKDCWVNAY